MSKKAERLVLGQLLRKLAPKIGARVVLEPQWRIAGQITFKNGRRSYFRYNSLDLNPVGASDIAKDKDYANFFMRTMGYPTIPGKTFFSDEWCEAIGSRRDAKAAARYARGRFPLIAKPNSGSHGSDVYRLQNERDLRVALRKILEHEKIALVQKFITGRDYRVVVLDNNVISAYERIPLNVIGDGRSTIKQLLTRKQKAFSAASRDTRIKLDDARIRHKLKAQKLSLRSVPARDRKVFLLDNANLSSGGDAVDVTKQVHPNFKKLAIKLTRDMGLRLCGVDLIVQGDIASPPKKFWILEVNAAPGLDHYVKTGRAQQKIVENMYLRVLKSLAK